MKTRVVFRKFKDGDIIALFPQEAADNKGLFCMSYMHIGQHGGADYTGMVKMTRPTTPDEYEPLKRELEQRGYDLKIAKKV